MCIVFGYVKPSIVGCKVIVGIADIGCKLGLVVGNLVGRRDGCKEGEIVGLIVGSTDGL